MARIGAKKTAQLLTAATATNGKPSGSSAGVSVNDVQNPGHPGDALLVVKSTAGSGTMTVTIRLWAYESTLADWFPLGVGADASKGTINAGSALGETDTDKIRHGEVITGLEAIDRLYAEITAIGGTSTAISAWIVTRV